jgi:transposase
MTYSYDVRKLVVAHVSGGGSQVEACRLYKISRKTIHNWLKLPKLSPIRTKQIRKRKLDKQLLDQHIRQFPDAILRERAEHFKVSHNAIWKSLRQRNIVKKND